MDTLGTLLSVLYREVYGTFGKKNDPAMDYDRSEGVGSERRLGALPGLPVYSVSLTRQNQGGSPPVT